jgi:hypothetical protein
MEMAKLAIFADTVAVVKVLARNLGHLEFEGISELSFALWILREAVAGNEEV